MSLINYKYNSVERWTLFSTILASSLVFIDGTAVTVAMPSIQAGVDATGSELLWINDAYFIFLSSLLLLGGSLGDHFGRNRIFSIGIIIFSLASASSGLSQSPYWLISSRTFQGIGGALFVPGSLAIITTLFPKEKVSSAIGLWSTFSALTAVVGPLLGGFLAQVGLWRLIFFLNVPFSAVALWGINKKVPETKDDKAKKLDFAGAILIVSGLSSLTFGLIESSNRGFNDFFILATLAFGVLTLIIFFIVERRKPNALTPWELFRKRNFGVSNLINFLIYSSLGVITFFLPLDLVQVQGYSQIEAGLALLPPMLFLMILSPLSGTLMNKYGAKIFLITGTLFNATGLFFFSFAGLTSGPSEFWGSFFWPSVIFGIGMGIIVAPLTSTIMRSIDIAHTGIASGINNAVSRMARLLSIGIFGAFGLILFRNMITPQINNLDLSESQKKEVLKETADFAGTIVPKGFPKNDEEKIKNIVKKSFVYSFNRVVYFASALVLAGILLAFCIHNDKTMIKQDE